MEPVSGGGRSGVRGVRGIGLALALGVLGTAAAREAPADGAGAEPKDPEKISAFAFDRDARVRRIVDLAWIRKGIPKVDPKDGIPAIREPRAVSAGDNDYVHDEDPVVGIAVNGEARAYPIRVLDRHEVVNDVLGGVALAATYCPLCDSAVAVRRDFDWDPARTDETITLGISGYLYESDVLLYDRETETFWMQILGIGAVGPHAGARLEQVPVVRTTWKAWRQSHPSTTLLSWRTEHGWPRETYASPAYHEYRLSKQVMFRTHTQDDRLQRKSTVYGLSGGDAHVAIPETAVSTWTEPVEVSVGGRRFRVRWVPEHRTPAAEVLGEPRPAAPPAVGEASAAPPGAAKEAWLPAPLLRCYWFAWSSFHPDTTVWAPPVAGGAR